jgi:hypothetical protein
MNASVIPILREELKDWQPFDRVEYVLAVAIGLLAPSERCLEMKAMF